MKPKRAPPLSGSSGVPLCPTFVGQALAAEMSEVVAAIPRDFLPQSREGEAGRTQGFAIDLMNEVAKRAQVRVTYHVFDTMHEVLAALERGDVDLVPNLGVTERRERHMLFTRPVQTTRVSLFVRESTSGIDSLTDLFGRTLGVVNGNVAEEMLDRRETDVRRIAYKRFPDALFGLLTGEVDALAYPETAAWKVIQETRLTDRIKVVGTSLMQAKYAIAVRRDLRHLLGRLDLAVVEVLHSPQYQKIYSRCYAAPPYWTVKRIGWTAGVATVVLAASLLAWSTLRLRGLNRRLDESVRQQSAILDSIPDIAWLKDRAGRFIAVNEPFGRACGRSPKDLVGKTDLDLWPAELVHGYRTDDREVMDRKERKQVEEQLVDSDGSQTWIETIKTPVLNHKGEVIGTTGIARDITSRKRVEATLRDSEQRFRDLADSASDWFWEMGPDLRFTWVSDQLEITTGISSASLISRSHEDLGKTLLQEEKWVQHLEDLRARRPFKDVQYSLGAAGTKDMYYVSVSGVAVFGESGEFRGYRGTGRDITAQVRAQNEAAQARQRLSDAIESISEGFALWDDNDRLVLCNSKNREFYSAIADILRPGISFEDVIREAMKRGACHLGGVEPQRWIQERLHQHRNPSGAWEQCLADGRWLLVTERRTPEGGIVGVRTDITAIKKAEEASCRSKEFLDHVLDAIDHDVFVKDERHRWVILNKAACELIGGSREELIGRSDDDFFSAEQTALNWKTDDETLESGNTIEYEWKAKKNGQCRTFSTKKSAFSDSSSGKQYIAGVAIDITERKRAEEALFHEKERAQVTLHCIGDGVITTDPSCGVEYLNPVAEALTGWTTEEAQGNPLAVIFNILEEQSRTPVPNPVARCLKEGQIVGLANHTVLISRYGQEHAIEDSASPIRGRDGEVLGAVLVFHDVTETRRMARQLQHDAAHDELTGLVNRREFEKRLERALVSAKRYGFHHVLCYFDLDQFKLVNDAAGHAAGDALLKQVRGLVCGKFRERDTLARLGGDEFALLLEHCALHEAIRIAEIVVATFRKWRFVWNNRTFQVGVSIGVVAITSEAETAAQLLAQADVACYAAKERGRNRAHVYQKNGAEPSPHHAQILIAATLRDALEQNRFRLFCQPIIELSESKGTPRRCYELLVRLLDADGHLMLPKGFIPAAERYGLMSAIDRWVIESAFRAFTESLGASKDVDIAINLSGDSLNDETFPEFVLKQFDRFSVPPGRVCFEITETAAIHNLDHAIAFITEVKKRGSRFALDDFGSGLSSFKYLRALPVDCLKIDGSFVQNMADDPRDEAVVAAINEVGHALGITTIAEYAHSTAIVDRLRRLGVNCAQGHALGAPMPLEHMLLEPDPPLRMETCSSSEAPDTSFFH